MPVVRNIKGRGVNGVLVVAAEPLFSATGDVGRWTNGVSQRVRIATARAAPTNKRPRWAHYGKPLKQTFTASTAYEPSLLRVYAGIGSTAPHALYVDQGTSPFMAKLLPPWPARGYWFRESTYKYPQANGRNGMTWKATGGIPVSGQRAQNFFATGLANGLAASNIRTVPLPVGGDIEGVIDGIPTSLTGASGNTPVDDAFKAQRDLWRAERTEAWLKYQRERPRKSRARGRRRTVTQADRRRWWREAQQRKRDRDKANPKPQDEKTKADMARKKAIQEARADFIRRVYARYGDLSNGTKVGTPKFVTEDGKSFWQVKVTLKNGEVRTLQDRVKF